MLLIKSRFILFDCTWFVALLASFMSFCFPHAFAFFWLSLIVQCTSVFTLNCTDLNKVSAEDNNHVILMVVFIGEIVGHCLYIQYCSCAAQV